MCFDKKCSTVLDFSLPWVFFNGILGILMTNSIIFQGSSTSSSGGESSCDESRIRKPRLRTAEPRLRTTALNEKLREDCPIDEPGSSDYNSSTGEESCDTVIYVGPDGAISDRELTDNEGPPTRLPLKNSRVSSSTQSLVRKLESWLEVLFLYSRFVFNYSPMKSGFRGNTTELNSR